MAIYFISDLHLAMNTPAIGERFQQFLAQELGDAQSLYILGDLFEYWIGDDAVEQVGMTAAIQALKNITDSGIDGYFIAGNRDFLVGKHFAEITGFKVLEDGVVVDLFGTPTVLLHGDALCTDDIKHQQFRQQMMTNADWHKMALAKPIEERIAIAKQMRGLSAEHKMTLADSIMDVNDSAVTSMLEEKGVTQMIHGHTHRPNIHDYQTSAGPAQRFVLGDWYEQQSFIRVDQQGCQLSNLAEQ